MLRVVFLVSLGWLALGLFVIPEGSSVEVI